MTGSEQPILGLFSRFVRDLEGAEALPYVKGHAPLHARVLLPVEEWAESLG